MHVTSLSLVPLNHNKLRAEQSTFPWITLVWTCKTMTPYDNKRTFCSPLILFTSSRQFFLMSIC